MPGVAQMGNVETWLSGWLTAEAVFVERVTSKLPPTSPNFARIVEWNEAGEFPASAPTDLCGPHMGSMGFAECRYLRVRYQAIAATCGPFKNLEAPMLSTAQLSSPVP